MLVEQEEEEADEDEQNSPHTSITLAAHARQGLIKVDSLFREGGIRITTPMPSTTVLSDSLCEKGMCYRDFTEYLAHARRLPESSC